MERKGAIKVKGNPVTLVGPALKTGDVAPDFTVVGRDLKEVSLKDFAPQAKLISVALSLDTPVCDSQARKFNEQAANLPEGISIINITMDLPFAISRFCETAGIDRIKTYSDYRYASFGNAYGVLIKELRLLARSIFLIGSDNRIRYIEIVPEATKDVDFNAALEAANKLFAGR
ncbi:MAG: thiol peroxidase [Deltaproteobacteria bacterium]|nr:thiol peroxidase [Deltaproteobacteria bacterium]